ncbi:hypothetical protein GCM10027569_68530 [Flindersiella endophytica]
MYAERGDADDDGNRRGEQRVDMDVRRFAVNAVLLAALGLLAGCGGFGWFGGGKECPAIGYLQGVSLKIEPSFASGVSTAALKVCWDGACQNVDVPLNETRDTISTPCEGSDPDAACGATAGPPDGGQYGFAEIPELPGKPVQVTVVLRSAAGEVVLDKQLTVRPKEPKPDDSSCGGGAGRFQTGIVVADGKLRERG